MTWVIVSSDEGQTIYGRIDDDGLMRVTAVREYPELQEWIELNGEPKNAAK